MNLYKKSFHLSLFCFLLRALFFGVNEIEVRVPSLFKLLIKEVRILSAPSLLPHAHHNALSGAALTPLPSLPPSGLESLLHLPALQHYSVEY